MAVRPALHRTTVPGRTKRLASLVICISRLEVVPHVFLPFDTWPTWAYPARYRRPWLFRPSQCCAFCPALRLGDHGPRGPSAQPFHVLHPIQKDLGPLCYTGSPVSSRRATFDNPDSTACHFGGSLNQPRMAPCSYSAYERSVSFDQVLRF